MKVSEFINRNRFNLNSEIFNALPAEKQVKLNKINFEIDPFGGSIVVEFEDGSKMTIMDNNKIIDVLGVDGDGPSRFTSIEAVLVNLR